MVKISGQWVFEVVRPLVGSRRRLGGVDWAVGWGSPKKKRGAGGLEGWPVQRRTGGGEWFRGGRGGVAARAGRGRRGPAVRPVVAGGSGGVEFDDKLEALDFASNGWKI